MNMGDDLQRFLFALAILTGDKAAENACHDWMIDCGVEEVYSKQYVRALQDNVGKRELIQSYQMASNALKKKRGLLDERNS